MWAVRAAVVTCHLGYALAHQGANKRRPSASDAIVRRACNYEQLYSTNSDEHKSTLEDHYVRQFDTISSYFEGWTATTSKLI